MTTTDQPPLADLPDDPNGIRGKRVLIMGLGLLGGGVAAARYAAESGAAEVVVTDLRTEEILRPSMTRLEGLPLRYVLGQHDVADFQRADIVVRNPGVPRTSPFLAAAVEAGARVEMEIAWFFRACRGKIAGITGTRGKTTTTALLHHILARAGLDTVIGGNLGGVETLSLLPRITPETWVVLELGNFMLEGLHAPRLSPHLAVFTNLLPDHLNAYASMEEYGEAKSSIFRYQRPGDIAIFNADNVVTRTFSAEAPTRNTWLFSPSAQRSWRRDDPGTLRAFSFGGDIRLRGAHNLANVQAATLAARCLKVPRDVIHEAVASFAGVPHRLESVRTLDGVTFINDSASTAPVACSAALRSFEAPVVLIAGGNSKQLEYDDLAREAVARTRHIVLLKGNATSGFAEALRRHATGQGKADPVTGPFDDLAAAVSHARRVAHPGDVVLFSPGFTSFGMFLNEFDRGDQFRALVQSLPER